MKILRGLSRTTRVLCALAIGAAGILVMLNEQTVRAYEAMLTTWILSQTFGAGAFLLPLDPQPSVNFTADGSWYGIVITPECSTAFFVGPIMLLTAVFVLIPRFSPLRAVVAGVVAVVLLAAVNEARLLGLAYVLSHWGREQFEWWHSLGGSFVMLAGLALVLFLFFVIVVRRQHDENRMPA